MIGVYNIKVEPALKCEIKGRQCSITKIIVHPNEGQLLMYHYSNNDERKTDFVRIKDLKDNARKEFCDRYPEWCIC